VSITELNIEPWNSNLKGILDRLTPSNQEFKLMMH